MNICIIGQYPPQVGGVATYTKQLEDTLTNKGHNVYVLTYSSDCSRKDNVFEAKTINIPLLRGISFIISSYFILNKIVDKYNIDIIHANYLLPQAFVATLIHKDVKIVATAHGSDINILPSKIFTKPLIKYTLKHLDNVYFVSEKLQKKALALNIEGLIEKSHITPNTVDTNKFKPISDDKKKLYIKYKKPLVMFIGNLVVQKGLKYLLKAKEISKTEYVLLIYGDGPKKEELKEYINQHNIKDIYLMGKTNIPEKIIPESDIMVLPSISEGASIVALESMSCQKPLIATDTGNIQSIITNNENGVIVPVADYEKLANAIDKLVDDEDKRNTLGKNARKTIERDYSQMKIPYIN